jgi:hypothetical protein
MADLGHRKSRFLYIAVGVLFTLVLLGTALAFLGSDWLSVWIGRGLIVLGSFGAAYVVGQEFGQRSSENRQKTEVSLLTGTLETAASQIGGCLRRAQINKDSADIIIAAIEPSLQQIVRTITDLGRLVDRRTSDEVKEVDKVRAALTAEIRALQSQVIDVGLATKQLGKELITDLSAPNGNIASRTTLERLSHVEEIESRVSGLLENLDEKVNALARHEGKLGLSATEAKKQETVKCPTCDNEVSFEIGIGSGSSAMPTCGRCNTRFNAHRGSNGIFTRLLGPGGGPGIKITQMLAKCPGCKTSIPFLAKEGKPEKIERYCFTCGHKSLINTSDGSVLSLGPRVIIKGILDGDDGLVCSKCNRDVDIGPYRRIDGAFIGACRQDDCVVKADSVPELPRQNS